MPSSPSPLVILSGIFQVPAHGDALVYPSDGPTRSVISSLEGLVGREVDAVAHHFPPDSRREASAGGGSCLLGASCKAGHLEDPAFLFSQKLNGILSLDETTLSVGGVPLDLASLDGHYGRLIVFAEGVVNPDASVEQLLVEAAAMTELLSSLRGTLKATT